MIREIRKEQSRVHESTGNASAEKPLQRGTPEAGAIVAREGRHSRQLTLTDLEAGAPTQKVLWRQSHEKQVALDAASPPRNRWERSIICAEYQCRGYSRHCD